MLGDGGVPCDSFTNDRLRFEMADNADFNERELTVDRALIGLSRLESLLFERNDVLNDCFDNGDFGDAGCGIGGVGKLIR